MRRTPGRRRTARTSCVEHMPKAKVFWEPPDTLRFALGEIKGPGLALEFGVATGSTLKIIADTVAGDRTVAGFDVFTGLPETWRTGFPAGEFAQEPPDIAGARVVDGPVRGHPARVSGRQRRTDRLRPRRLRSVLVGQDGVGSGWPTGSPPMRCWCSTSSSTTRAGGSTSIGPGPNSSLEQDVRSSIWRTRATTNRSSCDCTDQLS